MGDARLRDPSLSDAELHRAGTEAGLAAVLHGYWNNPKVDTGTTGQSYPDYYSQVWAANQR